MTWFLFLILYKGIPNTKVYFKHAIIGSFIAAILFELAKHLFAIYVRIFPSYFSLYGALATIPLFLIWLYTTWFVILYGAVLTRILSLNIIVLSRHKLPGFRHAFRWISYFYSAYLKGEALTVQQLIKEDHLHYEIPPEKMIDIFLENNWIKETQDHSFILSIDFSSLSLQQLAHQLPFRIDTANDFKFDLIPLKKIKKIICAN